MSTDEKTKEVSVDAGAKSRPAIAVRKERRAM